MNLKLQIVNSREIHILNDCLIWNILSFIQNRGQAKYFEINALVIHIQGLDELEISQFIVKK